MRLYFTWDDMEPVSISHGHHGDVNDVLDKQLALAFPDGEYVLLVREMVGDSLLAVIERKKTPPKIGVWFITP